MGNFNGVGYCPTDQIAIAEKDKVKLEEKYSKFLNKQEAGTATKKDRLSLKMSEMGYNFTRKMTGTEKSMPNANAVKTAIDMKRMKEGR